MEYKYYSNKGSLVKLPAFVLLGRSLLIRYNVVLCEFIIIKRFSSTQILAFSLVILCTVLMKLFAEAQDFVKRQQTDSFKSFDL